MKRFFTLFAVIMFTFALTACSGAGSSGAADEPAKAKKVLFVNQNLTGADNVLIKRLGKMGFEVTEMPDENVKADSAEGYDLIFIANTARHGKVNGVFNTSKVPTFNLRSNYAFVAGVAAKQDDTGRMESQTKINIKDASHPIASGLSGTVDVYKINGYMGYVKPGPNAHIVATAADDDSKATIFVYEKGQTSTSLTEAPLTARHVFFYLFSQEEVNQTEDSWKMFEAAVNYAMANE